MKNPYCFTDRNIKTGFKINLESHKNNQANSILTITHINPHFGIETRYTNKILKVMAIIYARPTNHYMFKFHISFSASFCRINEEDQRSDEIELFIYLKKIHNLTETDIANIDVNSQIEHQMQIQGTKESSWIFHKTKSMNLRFYKNCELNGSSYVKIASRSDGLINFKTDDIYCFFWSVLASLHPCENDQLNRVSNYKQDFDE